MPNIDTWVLQGLTAWTRVYKEFADPLEYLNNVWLPCIAMWYYAMYKQIGDILVIIIPPLPSGSKLYKDLHDKGQSCISDINTTYCYISYISITAFLNFC